jgi:omega-6 fatty acid desaturase (delta-12 desaturase)
VLHHGRTNVKHDNFLSPLDLAEYRALPPLRRALYRAYHSRSGAGILLYFLLERWPTVHLFPGAYLPQRYSASAWRYSGLVVAYAGSLIALLVVVASGTPVASLLCGFVLPYAIWYATFSMTVFLQHTHPQLRWYADVADLEAPPEALSVHVRMPGWINHATHYAMEHPVHHLSSMIPHYRLKQAQTALTELIEPAVITMPFTVRNVADVLRRCRLYDYDEHAWLDFDGRVTAVPPAPTSEGGKAEGLRPDQIDPSSPGVFFPAAHDAAKVDTPASQRREDA